MAVTELRRDLVKLLPENHPFIEKFDRAVTPVMEITTEEPEENGEHDGSSDYLNLLENVIEVVGMIDDWKRGIRDWDEVERALDVFKKETG